MLVIRDLYVHYGKTAALKGVSLHVNAGEAVGVVGPNGAGKSTLLMTTVGMLRPTAGEIVLEGQSLVGRPSDSIVRSGVSLVPEGRRILAGLTVRENLRLGAASRSDPAGFRPSLDEMFARFPILATYADTPAGRLSGGEQQQLAIARALIAAPRLLLLDEPSLGLAPLMVTRVFEILTQLNREGVTILLVEQNANQTIGFADRSYVLRTGEVEIAGTRAELHSRIDLAATYLGPQRTEA